MIDPLKQKPTLCWLLILQLVLVQQCLLQLNRCEAFGLLASLIPAGKQDAEDGAFTGKSLYNSSDDANNTSHSNNGDYPNEDHPSSGFSLIEGTKSIAGRIFDVAIAPTKSYYNLAKRYQKWRNQYTRLQQQYGNNQTTGKPILKGAIDVLRIEYAKVDRQLTNEACNVNGEKVAEDTKKQDTESMNFIWRILTLLIDQLETRLEMLERDDLEMALNGKLHLIDSEAEHEAERIEDTVQEAAARAKWIAVKSALNLALSELNYIAMLALINILDNYFRCSESSTQLLGASTSSLTVNYLRSFPFRGIIKLLNYPASRCKCQREPVKSLAENEQIKNETMRR